MKLPFVGASFPQDHRLRHRRDYQRLTRTGERFSTGAFVCLVSPSREVAKDLGARLGVTASRRVGGAVVRNRVKRQVREWFRRERAGLPRHKDLVVIVRSHAGAATRRKLRADLQRLGARLSSARSQGSP